MRIGRLFLVACGSTVALGSIGCAAAPRSAARALPDEAAWAGVYAATDPRGGSASLLSIRWVTLPDEATARPIYHLYARLGDAGRLDVVGAARIDGDRLTFAIATARLDEEGDSHAIATVERYVYRRAGGRVALIREESLEGNGGSLEGVLIKVADDAAEVEDEPSDAVTIGRGTAIGR